MLGNYRVAAQLVASRAVLGSIEAGTIVARDSQITVEQPQHVHMFRESG
jgi:hypothetical protein